MPKANLRLVLIGAPGAWEADSTMSATMMPSPHDRVRIAATATVDPRTVYRAYQGHAVYSTCRARIAAAAAALGLPPPPPPSSPGSALQPEHGTDG